MIIAKLCQMNFTHMDIDYHPKCENDALEVSEGKFTR